MEKVEAFAVGVHGEGDGVLDATVAPADVLFVFGGAVLSVKNNDFGVADEINDLAVLLRVGLAAGTGEVVGVVEPTGAEAMEKFDVWDVNDGAAGCKKPVTGAETGMADKLGLDGNAVDVEIELLTFLDADVAGHLLHTDGEVGVLHLAGESAFEALAGAFETVDGDDVLGIVSGKKKRKTLDVIPMSVGDEDAEIDRSVFELLGKGEAKTADAGASVKNDNFGADADFDAGGVAAVMDGFVSWGGNGTADTPELKPGGAWGGIIRFFVWWRHKGLVIADSLSG